MKKSLPILAILFKKKKTIILFLILFLTNYKVQSQVFDGNLASKSLMWSLEQKDFTLTPRTGVNPMSIKLWDNYNGTGSPSTYGSLLEISGRSGHLVSQLYFKSTTQGSQILYRSAFYNQTTWSDWRSLLDSGSDVESAGLLKIKGVNNSYIAGNVGIGTTAPIGKLDINTGSSTTYNMSGQGSGIISFGNPGNISQPSIISKTTTDNASGLILFAGTSDISNAADMRFDVRKNDSNDFTTLTTTAFRFTRAGISLVNILRNGSVGIGTSTPSSKFHIVDTNGGIFFNGTNTDYNRFKSTGVASATGKDLLFSAQSIGTTPDLYIDSALGNVGIGTANPGSKLTVKGTIHATEVKVTADVPADYVFEKYYLGQSSLKPDYTLLTLSEIAEFTKKNHHLPNVPSAKDIKENGLHLGEMSNILLQKIEELTLYSIDQQKTIERQAAAIEKLEKQNDSFKNLEERLATIEKELHTKK